MTVADIEKKSRRILGDTIEEYRWSREEIRDHIQEGLKAINAIRPETRYVNGVLASPAALPENDDAEFALAGRYEEALVYFTVHKCYLDDDTDTTNAQLADSYLAKFNMKVQL